ncbi:MAG TPA: SAM-dependent methyltransferase, partial [Tahibacter sp.]|nr:SAM-dependent methyltransferase [Tahibacter sp.]
DVWHDRAVFHFLTGAEERAAYRRQVGHALKSGGQFVIATFAPDGPARCSGLPVVRYDAAGLQQMFGGGFQLLEQTEERHETPGGNPQPFTWCRFRRL